MSKGKASFGKKKSVAPVLKQENVRLPSPPLSLASLPPSDDDDNFDTFESLGYLADSQAARPRKDSDLLGYLADSQAYSNRNDLGYLADSQAIRPRKNSDLLGYLADSQASNRNNSGPGYLADGPLVPRKRLVKKKKAKARSSNVDDEVGEKLLDPNRPSKMIKQNDLIRGKRLLHGQGARLQQISLDRKELFDTFETFDYFPILFCKTFLKSEVSSGDIVSLNFSGIDQLTDAFFYTLLAEDIHLRRLRVLLCSGCFHLTDLSVKWMVQMFPTLKTVNFNGCYKVTEKSLHRLCSSSTPPTDILMMGTNVGVDRPDPVNGTVSCKLSGCPVVSHSGPGATENVPLNVHKVVILLDKKISSAVGQQLTGQSGGLEHERGVAFWPNWKHDKSTYSFNLFEVAYDETAADLVLSDGCIVILPFPENGVSMETVVNSVYTRMMKVACRYPDSVCVILGEKKEGGDNSGGSLNNDDVAANLRQKIQTLSALMSKEISDTFQWEWIFDHFIFPSQIYFSQWVKQSETLADLQFLQYPTSGGISSSFKRKPSSQPFYKTLQEAIQKLDSLQPYYKTVSKELMAISTAVQGCPLQSLSSASSLVPEGVRRGLHPHNALPHIEKGLQILQQRGILMYFGSKESGVVAGNVDHLIKGVNQLLNSTAARTPVACVEPGVLCWKHADLLQSLESSMSQQQAKDILSVLGNNGCLLPLFGEAADVGDPGTAVCVCVETLPERPPAQLAGLWPVPIPESEIQVERLYTFTPELPASLLTSFFRYCNQISPFRVLWRRGVLMNQGPVDILIQQDWNDQGMPVVAVCCRTFKPEASTKDAVRDCVWSSRNTFTKILDFVIKDYGVFAKVTVPCPTCVPSKDLRLQLRGESCYQFHPLTFTSGHRCKREGPDSQEFTKSSLMGEGMLTMSVVPRHNDWYLGLTKSTFVHTFKCYQCNRVNRDRSGQEQILCPNCGTCCRCVKFMADIEKALMPGFSHARGSKGSVASTNAEDSLLPINHSMEARLFNDIRIMLMRGKTLIVILKMQTADTEVKFDAANGCVTGPGSDQSETNVTWQCKEGDTIALQLTEGKTSAELQIVCRLNGFVIWSRDVEKQTIMPQFSSGKDSLGFVLETPGIGELWQAPGNLDRLTEKMCLEFSKTEDDIVSARVMGNNGQVVSLIIDHMANVSLENSYTVELTSDKLHPPGYAHFKGKALNGKSDAVAYQYDLPDKFSFAPLWLFNETQRGGCAQLRPGGTTPAVMPCVPFLTPAAILCKMNQMVPRLETAVYKNGGIDFTGSAVALVPSNKTKENIQWPARHLVGSVKNLQCHSLCYIRAECEDMLVLHPAKQTLKDRNPYWQLHFLNAEGFPMPEDFTADESCLPLIWAWHVLVGSQELRLPDTVDQFCPELASELAVAQIESALQEYVKWQSCLLALNIGPDFTKTDFFEDIESLTQASKVLRTETKERLAMTGLQEFVTVLSADTIYLCPAHVASQQIDAGLEQIPFSDFSCYKSFITSFKIEGNKLEFLPENFFIEFPSLLDLQLVGNSLFSLPSGIGSCKNLCNLKLRDNQLQTLPADLAKCKKLTLLEITRNPMAEIPAVVTEIKSLERLYASFMQIHNLPENIGNLTNLDVLNVSGNCLSSLPESFCQLKKLTQLYLNGIPWMPLKQNTLLSKDHFEKYLEKHANLLDWLEDHDHDKALLYKQFDEDQNGTLDVNEVAKLNATLFHIFPRFGHKGTQLPEDETFSGFPEEILGLENLEYLSLQYQGLVTLPETIKTLRKLSKINLSHNPYLTTVAAAAGELPLQTLGLEDCPSLKTPPKEIRARGFSSTYAYLRRLLTGSVDCHRTKLMFVGLGGAGKTSLSRALLSGNLRTEANAAEAITDGIDISTWTVKSGEDHISYSVWDFAGQTVYYNTHQFFLSDRAVYLLLWNIRLGHEHAGLDFWLSSISVHAPKAPIFVVGTHLDKVSKTEIPIAEMKQKYPQIAGFHFVSSHSGKGVEELQKHIFEVTLQQPYMGEKIPGVWLNFEKKIMVTQRKESVVKYKDIELMSSEAGIFDQSEVSQAVQFLHDLGSLQHFNNEFLKSYVVINPQWIVDVMTCVVSVKDSPIQEGRLYHKDIGVVWKDYPEELHEWLLRLTEEFDLTFPMTDQQLNLVPCLLPEAHPQIDWPEVERNSSERETKMIYRFTYLPAGLFNRGQVRLYQFSDSSVIWKRGSLLRKNGHRALLQQTQTSELVVKVQGPRPENILFLIHEVFEGLIGESFQGVTYDFLIPCPDCLKAASREPHMFAASTVRRASELKAPFLQCMKYFHTISVIDLLASMPPDNNTDYDIHLVSAVRGLKDLKKDLSADLFISYCPQNFSHPIGPDKVHTDLIGAGYRCWFPKDGRLKNVDQMAKALMDCQVFVALVSNEYVVDKNCCDIFKYARLILKKPIILVVVGKGFEWRQSKLGILLADDVFVNMQKVENYQDKLRELLGLIRERSQFENKDVDHPPCFISYSWQNSAAAVAKGTRQTAGALGYGDPRGIKDHLEKNGVSCWIDVERVGVNGLFEDIAEGLLNAKMMVACVSDEYAMSANCQFEFRFAANTLKLPIVLAIMGTGNAWRAKEVGFLSIDYPMVSFQEKSESAHQKLLTLVTEKLETHPGEDPEAKKKKKNEVNESHKNMSFQELYELAQRKFLRQVAYYAAKQEALYPRLFVADFVSDNLDDDDSPEDNKTETAPKSDQRPPLISRVSKASIDVPDDNPHDFHNKKFCFYLLCEHEEGWHSCSSPLKAPDWFGQSKLEKYSPYLARITTILRYNRQIMLNCMAGQDGDTYLHWLEQNPQAVESDFQNTYHELRQEIMNADESGLMGKLARCHLPNGKTIWLCEEHQKASRVTVLSNDFGDVTTGTAETTTENLILDYLSEMDRQAVMEQFEPSANRTWKALKKRHAERKNKVPPPPIPRITQKFINPESSATLTREATANTDPASRSTSERQGVDKTIHNLQSVENSSKGSNPLTHQASEVLTTGDKTQKSEVTAVQMRKNSFSKASAVSKAYHITPSQLQKMNDQLKDVNTQRRIVTESAPPADIPKSRTQTALVRQGAVRKPEQRPESSDNRRRANKSKACIIT